MSSYNEALSYPLPSRGSPAHFALGAVKRLETWLERMAVRAELTALDGRTLKDLGITSGDFAAIVNGTFQHPRGR